MLSEPRVTLEMFVERIDLAPEKIGDKPFVAGRRVARITVDDQTFYVTAGAGDSRDLIHVSLDENPDEELFYRIWEEAREALGAAEEDNFGWSRLPRKYGSSTFEERFARYKDSCGKGHHSDPDNSGMCIQCSAVLEVEEGTFCGGYAVTKEDEPAVRCFRPSGHEGPCRHELAGSYQT